MPFKGTATLVIQPCYDGQALPGTHQVAGDGLALLSIKDAHRNCTLGRDLGSKRLTLSCTRGIKPRNSFWNIHKPDLRRVKCLECTTTDKVVELFQTHDIESNSVKTYRKKVVSKLGSIISKKSKTKQSQVLVQNVSWPINFCVLSSVCQETELVTPGLLINEQTEETIKKHEFETSSTSKVLTCKKSKDTVFITFPSLDMLGNTSDDYIPGDEVQDPSNGDCSTKTITPFNSRNNRVRLEYGGSWEVTSSQPGMSSSILLESKQSHHQISIPSNVEFYKEKLLEKKCEFLAEHITNVLSVAENNQLDKNNINADKNLLHQDGRMVTESPSSVVVQSIFSDIFQDIEEIKNAINSYMSSFYVQEEEHNNFPAMHLSSQEVTSHFLRQIHEPLADKNCNPRNMHSTFSQCFSENVQNSLTKECSIHRSTDTKLSQTIDLGIKYKDSSQDNFAGLNFTEQETLHTYCYWDDNDLVSELLNGKLSGTIEDVSIPEENNNLAIVPLKFIEKLWEEFKFHVETHAIFVDLVKENEVKKIESRNSNFPSYGHWAHMYDPSIFQEAENIVYTLDSLLMNGCFPSDECNNASFVPCTIVELVDEREFAQTFLTEANDNGDKQSNREESTWMDPEFIFSHEENAYTATHLTNENIIQLESISDKNINQKKIHEIKLEPVFYQEKLSIHEVEYSRVPEYQKIELDPINHQGRFDFSSLQSNGSNIDDLTANELKRGVSTEIANKSRDNLQRKYVKDGNFIEDSKVPTGQSNEDRLLINEYSKNDADTKSSMFERIQDKNSPGNPNPAFLFSSPTVQLNLTNPYINNNKK